MKQTLSVVAFALLAAGMASAANVYTHTQIQGANKDVTTMTNTVNAWKYMAGNPVCTTASLTLGSRDHSVSCMGANGGPPYMFNPSTKSWAGHPEMGTAPVRLIVVNWGPSPVIYSLQPTATCGFNYGGSGRQSYDLFKWNGSAWTQPHPNSCMFQASSDEKGTLDVVGWDGVNHITALFQSTNGGQSWALWSDSWQFVQMTSSDHGCAIANAGSIWEVFASNSPLQFPNLPSGTAAGCALADNPSVAVAWTTSGSVYSMPLENWGTWRTVAGISAKAIIGAERFRIYGEDASGKPYHWNLNAPGITSYYGGQWPASDGCPSPGQICASQTTHTVCHTQSTATGHGVGGARTCSTQVFTNNIQVYNEIYNPLCDPFVGLSGDTECTFILSGDAKCNQSDAVVGNTDLNWVVDDSIDVLDYSANKDQFGPTRVITGPGTGYWLGQVDNWISDGCAISDPVPQCPVDTSQPITLHNQVDYLGSLYVDAALAQWQTLQNWLASDASSPYVSHGFYIAQQLSDGTLVDKQCFGGYIGDSDILGGQFWLAPACK